MYINEVFPKCDGGILSPSRDGQTDRTAANPNGSDDQKSVHDFQTIYSHEDPSIHEISRLEAFTVQMLQKGQKRDTRTDERSSQKQYASFLSWGIGLNFF